MILFKQQHVALIVQGRKTQTRRLGNKRWNVGAIHQCRTRMMDPDSTFARVKIIDVRRQKLGDVTHVEALAEGYSDRFAYWQAFCEINGIRRGEGWLDTEVWAVEFRLAR